MREENKKILSPLLSFLTSKAWQFFLTKDYVIFGWEWWESKEFERALYWAVLENVIKF